MKLTRRKKYIVKSFLITAFVLGLVTTVLLGMGYAYTVTEKNAYGNTVSAFSLADRDNITVFGKEVYFPLIGIVESVADFFKKYSSGVIKLLGFAVNTVKELAERFIMQI